MRISYCSSDVCSSDLCRVIALFLPSAVSSGSPVDLDRPGAQHCAHRHRLDRPVAQRRGEHRRLLRPLDMKIDPTRRGDQGQSQGDPRLAGARRPHRSEEHTSELQSLMRISYAVFCLKKKKITHTSNKQPLINM